MSISSRAFDETVADLLWTCVQKSAPSTGLSAGSTRLTSTWTSTRTSRRSWPR